MECKEPIRWRKGQNGERDFSTVQFVSVSVDDVSVRCPSRRGAAAGGGDRYGLGGRAKGGRMRIVVD